MGGKVDLGNRMISLFHFDTLHLGPHSVECQYLSVM